MTDPKDRHEKLQAEVLAAALPHVPFDGWTMAAAEAGAAAAGLAPGSAARAFPEGPVEMIEVFSRLADRKMVAEMAKRGAGEMRVRDRITLGVRVRLEANSGHREAARRALALLAMPTHAAVAAKCLYRTVDAIWYAAGDTATDYNFYTKRGLLAGVYGATLLYWLDDDSEGCAATWAFLDRRIAEVLKIPRAIAGAGKWIEGLANPLRRGRRRGRPGHV